MPWHSLTNIDQGPHGIEITIKWFGAHIIMIGAACAFLAFDLVVRVWPGIGSWSDPWLALLEVIAASALFYYALAGCINRTRIKIKAPRIIISSGPLPWPGNNRTEITDIRMVYNTMALRLKKYRRYRNFASFVVMAVTGDNQHIQVLNAESRENADEIEKIIKAQLGLKPTARPKPNKPKSN